MDIQKEREAFEDWFVVNYHDGDIHPNHHLLDFKECDQEYVDDLVNMLWEAWQAAKENAVQASRTDFEIIDSTIQLVDLLGNANRFQRDKSKPLPFESENPRNMEWWRLACQIQELLTATDPNNCDFEEYKTMIEAQEPTND